MNALKLKAGHVLVDPDGNLYEVVAVHMVPDDTPDGVSRIFAWLWPDSSPTPNFFQVFEPTDDIVGINTTPSVPNPAEETAVIPVVEESENVPVPDGTAE